MRKDLTPREIVVKIARKSALAHDPSTEREKALSSWSAVLSYRDLLMRQRLEEVVTDGSAG